MKIRKTLSIILLALFSVFLFTACDEETSGKYRVSFVTNCEQEIEDLLVEEGTFITEPELEEIPGKELEGWYKDVEFKDDWNFNLNVVVRDITLYAKWNDVVIEPVYETVSIVEAKEIASAAGDAYSTEKYYIEGTIKEITNSMWGNMYITDGTNDILIYGTYSEDGKVRYDALETKPKVGDKVVLYGILGTYNSEPQMKNGWLVDFEINNQNPEGPSIDVEPGSEITIAQALSICADLTDKTPDRYIIKATIKSITNAQYGAMIIEDETGTISVYGSYSADGEIGYAQLEEKPYAGYKVELSCILQNFGGNGEIYSAWILNFEEVEEEFDETQYEKMTIAEAREEADGVKVKITGVVAQITYANGKIPSGFYLVDDTSSIYVYDSQLTPRVKKGDKLTICASRTNWILESEQSYASKFGYTGCIQVENAKLVGDIVSNQGVDYSWVEETTVKELMDTDVSNNITTTIYKVNAYVNKSIGTGFINYYIDDIDGVTGSYVYTQCNGSDFGWLDEFDGKICTVYLSVINAKSTASGCVWRLLPIKVEDNNYQFDLSESADYAITYHARDQFLPSYTGNPNLELITSVSNELLGIENVTISYASDNTNVVYFEVLDDKTIMKTNAVGVATITITATYQGYTATRSIEIEVKENPIGNAISVEEAIEKEVNDIVEVHGIVGPSLVNKVGFYLMGENAIIAVVTTEAVMDTIEIGHEVVISGKRDYYTSSTGTYGQTCITNAEVVANLYGENEYNTSYFEETTVQGLYDLDYTQDFTTKVFTVTCSYTVYTTNYSSTPELIDENGKYFSFYCSGAGQYQWLTDVMLNEDGTYKTGTFEIAVCNWNSKTYYRGCVLSVTLEDGTKVYNNLNFS